jgi:hypothetical protein
MVVGKRKLKGAISAPCGDPEIAHELDSGQESFVLLSCNNSDS